MIDKLIISLWQEKGKVTIPSLGTLIEKNGETLFVSYLKSDNGELFQYITSVLPVSSSEAREIINTYVETVNNAIDNKGKYVINGLGSLKKDINKVIYFELGYIEASVSHGTYSIDSQTTNQLNDKSSHNSDLETKNINTSSTHLGIDEGEITLSNEFSKNVLNASESLNAKELINNSINQLQESTAGIKTEKNTLKPLNAFFEKNDSFNFTANESDTSVSLEDLISEITSKDIFPTEGMLGFNNKNGNKSTDIISDFVLQKSIDKKTTRNELSESNLDVNKHGSARAIKKEAILGMYLDSDPSSSKHQLIYVESSKEQELDNSLKSVDFVIIISIIAILLAIIVSVYYLTIRV